MSDSHEADNLAALARSGDLDAAYELLGKQAPVDTWRGTIQILVGRVQAGEAIDLELVARRTIRRAPAVVTALLDLCCAVGSAQALFIARTAEAVRSDNQLLVDRAAAAAERLQALAGDNTQGVDEASADAHEELYLLLALPLPDQHTRWTTAPDTWRASLITAIRSERDRLRNVTRDTSATSGGYLHYLRHRLADQILVCGIGEDLGEWAYRILQLRTEHLDDLPDLLDNIPVDTRRRYLSWVITPRKDAPVDRITYLLRLATARYPDDMDPEELESLAAYPDPDVAAEAIISAVTLNPADRDVAKLASTAIATLPEPAATVVAGALVRVAAGHVKINVIPAERVPLLVVAVGEPAPDDLSRAITDQLATLGTFDALLPWVTALEQLGAPNAAFEAATAHATKLARDDPRPEAVARSLDPFLRHERFRCALWTSLQDVPPKTLHAIAPHLIAAGSPEDSAQQVGHALGQLTGEHGSVVRDAAIAGLSEGRVEPRGLAAAWPEDDRAAIAAELRDRMDQAERERAHLETDLTDIATATRRDLARDALPAISDAIDASAANPGIQHIYQRLADALQPATDDGPAVDKPPAPRTESAPAAEGGTDHERLEQLIQVDADTLTTTDAQARLAEGGFAEHVLTDLFERGALFQLAVRLDASTRTALLAAALGAGLDPPPEWFDHPALGAWLRQELALATPTGDGAQPVDIAVIFDLAAASFARLDATRTEVTAQRGVTSRELAGDVSPLLNELGLNVDSYYNVWRRVAAAGWKPVEVIGRRLTPDQLDAERHEIIAGHGSPAFVVRRSGIEADGAVVERAQLEGDR